MSLFPRSSGDEARVVDSTRHYLRHRAGAQAVLIEENYIDRDHRAAFSYFYSRQFRGTSSLCQRLHFFTTSDTWDALRGGQSPLRESYLGYVIQRPRPFSSIGRTVLSVEPTMIPGAAVYCRALFEPHINETRFGVSGVPFAQQDSMVMSCAETSIWIAARVMFKHFDHPLILPHDITRPETLGHSEYGRLLPSGGLTANQMTSALSALGFEPIFYDKETLAKGRRVGMDPIETCVPYLASKIPTILALPNHAVTACGVVSRNKRKLSTTGGLHSVCDWVDGLIVQDDTRGPYRIVPRDEELHVTLYGTDLRDLLAAQNPNPENVRYNSWWHVDQTEGIIIPLPQRVYLTAVNAQAFARRTLSPTGFLSILRKMLTVLAQAGHADARTFLEALLEDKHGGIVYSIRCRRSVDVRSDFAYAPQRVRDIMRDVPLPRRLWAIECTTQDVFVRDVPETRVLYGEFYLDATAHQHVNLPALVAARVVGAMLVRPDLCRGDDEPRVFSIAEDRAYYRPGIPLWSD